MLSSGRCLKRSALDDLLNIDNTYFERMFRPRGYKTFFMLNSTEHEISTANKN